MRRYRPKRARIKTPNTAGHHLRVIGQTVAQGEGHRKNPLACRDMRKHAVHQVRRGIRHSASATGRTHASRSEEHTSELQSRPHLVCRLLLEKKKETRRHPL